MKLEVNTVKRDCKHVDSEEAVASTREVSLMSPKSTPLTQATILTIKRTEANLSDENDIDKLIYCEERSLFDDACGEYGSSALGNGDVDNASQRAFPSNNDGNGDEAASRESSAEESNETNQQASATAKRKFDQMDEDAVVQNYISIQHNNAVPDTVLQHSAVIVTDRDPTLVTKMNLSARGTLLKHEDEFRKEKRKQSNRESAKRSRLRKRKECEDLQERSDCLKAEISQLTQVMRELSEESFRLKKEQDDLAEKMIEKYGVEAISDILVIYTDDIEQENSSKENAVSDHDEGLSPCKFSRRRRKQTQT